MRGTKTTEKFRQFAAAPEPIISPDAEVMSNADAATQPAPYARSVAETAEVKANDMPSGG